MKKTLTTAVHVIMVLLFTVSFAALYMDNVGDSGLLWLKSGSFEESPQFASLVNSDIASLKKLALYQSAFGDLDEIMSGESERAVVRALDSEKPVEYTTAELIEEAAYYGCSIDFSDGTVTFNDSPQAENTNNDIRVTEKAYDPGFLTKLEPGPSQGIMGLKELSIEVVKAVSEYISLAAVYEQGSSNFSYAIYYPDEENGYLSVTNTDMRADSLLKMGKYVHVEGISTEIDTNIEPAPLSAVYEPYSDEDKNAGEFYELFAGIDTSFPYQDRYREGDDQFSGKVRRAYTWMAAGIVSFIIAAITLVIILSEAGSGEEEHLSDRLPIEALAILLAAASAVFYLLYKVTLGKALDPLSPPDDRQFIRNCAKTLIVYGTSVILLRSGARKYRKGTLYDTSLFNRLELSIEDYLENAGLAGSAFVRFFFTVCLNAGLMLAACILYYRRELYAGNILIAAGLLTVIIIADALIYHHYYSVSKQRDLIDNALSGIAEGGSDIKLSLDDFSGGELSAAKSINNISVGLSTVIRDQVKSERLQADLITNVSHDLKTPLTSIINYVDLLKRENIENEKAREYLDILEHKSLRLKNLTEDLVEASKASSGNIRMDMCQIDIVELSIQAAGEFEDRFAARGLEFCFEPPKEAFMVMADGRHLWRVFENLFNNAAKYSMENTRVYAEVYKKQGFCVFVIKNISQTKLNISPEELTERFVRGDVSRTTEGSGLGLSIAQSLTKLMGGELKIEIDGDLYKASVILPEAEEAADEKEEAPEA